MELPDSFIAGDYDYEESETATEDTESEAASEFEAPPAKRKVGTITQALLDHIIAILWLTKRNSEQLASWLYSLHLLAPDAKVTAYRNRQSELEKCYVVSKENTFTYCPDIRKLMDFIGIMNYNADDWRLFIDGSNKGCFNA